MHHVLVHHHVGQTAVALQRVRGLVADDGFLLPVLQPEVARHPAVVLVGLAVAPAPVVELARRDAQPVDEAGRRDAGLLAPAAHKVHDGIPRVVGNPGGPQSSPSSVFNATYSSITC